MNLKRLSKALNIFLAKSVAHLIQYFLQQLVKTIHYWIEYRKTENQNWIYSENENSENPKIFKPFGILILPERQTEFLN